MQFGSSRVFFSSLLPRPNTIQIRSLLLIDDTGGTAYISCDAKFPRGASVREVEDSCEGESMDSKKSHSKKLSKGWCHGGCRGCDTVRRRSDAGNRKTLSEG